MNKNLYHPNDKTFKAGENMVYIADLPAHLAHTDVPKMLLAINISNSYNDAGTNWSSKAAHVIQQNIGLGHSRIHRQAWKYVSLIIVENASCSNPPDTYMVVDQ